MQSISTKFPIMTEEYELLDEKFGKLCHYASWQLNKKNSKNNHTDDPEDTVQELRIALLRAGSYYKRQVYIEESFRVIHKHITDPFLRKLWLHLRHLWKNRKRHGANRQKFGIFQEIILDQFMESVVPPEERPAKEATLKMDLKFTTYCKQIIWNAQKQMGKKITREKSWRTGLVSLSEFDFLGAVS